MGDLCDAQSADMSDNELPALPSAAATDGLEGMEALERVDWSHADELPHPESVATVSHEDWLASLNDHADTEEVLRTLCTVQLRGLPGEVPLDPDSLEAIALQIGSVHTPVGGVSVGGEHIVLALPDGASWVAIATTIERAVVELGRASTSVHVGFGLADSGFAGQTLADAVRLSQAAAEIAYERNLGASIMTLADEAFEGRDQVVAKCLENALDENRGLRLVFQPKIDTGTQAFVGAEVLLRFQCDELGHVGPSEFFPIAARTGLLSRLENWVIEQAIPHIAALASQRGLRVPVSINVRGADLLADGFVERIGVLLDENELDPALLRVEVTEADVLARLDEAEERLGALRTVGVSVALDDFGKEGATLADLRRLPLDVVKVHRAFTRDMESDETSSALIQGVMSLARAIGIETVAVGVESWTQFETLRSYGCSAVQGFLFSKPLEALEFAERLGEQADFGQKSAA